MEAKLTYWIVTVIMGIVFSLLIRLLMEKDKKKEADIEFLKKKNIEQDLELQHLKDKLWSEEKLTGVIVDAVRVSMTDWENKMLKSGFIHNHTRKDDE